MLQIKCLSKCPYFKKPPPLWKILDYEPDITKSFDGGALFYIKFFLRSDFGTSPHEYFKENPAENSLLVPCVYATAVLVTPYWVLMLIKEI